VRSGIGFLRFGAREVPARSGLGRVVLPKGFAPYAADRDVPRSGSTFATLIVLGAANPGEFVIAFLQLGVILMVFEAVDANIPASWACSRKGRWHLSRLAKLEQRKSKL